ncbi:MAG TPA: hypothetical protein VK464_06870, partial [Symbiobacteriaceae bacterium]|nr:hypothetical protein [Symbiobacteriaceae bacterium]
MIEKFLAGQMIGGMQPIYESPLQVKNPYFIAGTESTLDLTKAAPSDTLPVRARVPARLVLKGPADLLFGEFNLIFTAQTLTRDLNDTAYGVVRTDYKADTTYKVFRLPEPAYVERFVADEGYTSGDVWALEAGGKETQLAGSGTNFKCGLTVTGFRAKNCGTSSDVEILSPSSASQVVVALPDGTPLHSFPAVFDPEAAVEIATRDLTEALNKAWPINGGNLVLLVTSLTDGQLQVAARGTWARTAANIRAPGADAGPELTADLHPFAPLAAEVPLGAG